MNGIEQSWWQIVIPDDQHDRLLELLDKTYGYSVQFGPTSEINGKSCRAYYFARRIEAEQLGEEFGVEVLPAPDG
jgi:hypothetical protein